MRVDKRHRGKPLPRADIDSIAKFRAELLVHSQLRARGLSHDEATRIVYAEDFE